MREEPYQNREIREMFETHSKSDEKSFVAIQASIEAIRKDTSHTIGDLREELLGERGILTRIEAQTTKTNGRVGRLEAWKNWVLGGAAVFVPIFIVVSSWLVLEQIDDNAQRGTNEVLTGVLNKLTSP